jgi:uncharacterized membrane protein YeaQ/YmgE (transglycosylase-associated protein family)
MVIVWSLLVGMFLGWLGSVLARTATSGGILVDILCGGLGAIVLSLLLASAATFDNVVAGYLGSVCALALLYSARRLRKRTTSN